MKTNHSTPTWHNSGVVRSVSQDRNTITISLPNGGRIDAPNAGFLVGDAVCFATSITTGEITRVVPYEFAQNERSRYERPNENPAPWLRPNDDEVEEVYDEYENAFDSRGPLATKDVDSGVDVIREDDLDDEIEDYFDSEWDPFHGCTIEN